MQDDESLKEQLCREHPEFQRFSKRHHKLDDQINRMLRRKKVLTPVEELQCKQLQIEKLHTKDRIEAIMREHRRVGLSSP